MKNRSHTCALLVATILCAGLFVRDGLAQMSEGDDPVPAMVQSLNSALKDGNATGFAALLTDGTGSMFRAFDAAVSKASTARNAFVAALKDKFHSAAEPPPADLSSLFRRLEKVEAKSTRRIDSDNYETELNFYWKETPAPAAKHVRVVRQDGMWKLETAAGPPDQVRQATEEMKKVVDRYQKFAAASDRVAEEVRQGKYDSALAARLAWRRATRFNP
jgi:hypothetical protein